MSQKSQRTRSELEIMTMELVSENPTCLDVLYATLTPVERSAPDAPNWRVSFFVNDPHEAAEVAFQIARELATRFDLAS
jgi:hypothetical protein